MLVAAAVLMFLLGLAHSVLGERYLLIRLFRRPDLPTLFGGTAFTTQTLRFAWHLTTVIAWGLAAWWCRSVICPMPTDAASPAPPWPSPWDSPACCR
jgi:hypothetical protein